MHIQKTQRGSRLLITKILLGITTAISLHTTMANVTLAVDSDSEWHTASDESAEEREVGRTIVVGENDSKELTTEPRPQPRDGKDDKVVSELVTGDVLRIEPFPVTHHHWSGVWVKASDEKGHKGWYKHPLPSDHITVAKESALLNRADNTVTPKFPRVCGLLPGDKLAATPGDNYRDIFPAVWRRMKKEDDSDKTIGWYKLTGDDRYADHEFVVDLGGHLRGQAMTLDQQLYHALYYGATEKIKELINNGVKINSLELRRVINDNNSELAQFLLDNGVSFNAQEWLDHEVSSYYSLPVIKFCIEHGANVNAQDHDGNTPLINTLKSEFFNEEPQIAAANYLLSQGANPFIKNKDGGTASDYIDKKNRWDESKSQKSTDFLRTILPSPIFQAVYDGNVDKVIEILSKDPAAAKQLWQGQSLRSFVQRRIKGLNSIQEPDVLQEKTRTLAELKRSQVNPALMHRLDQIADILGAYEHYPHSLSISPDQQKRLTKQKDVIPDVTQSTENILKAMVTPSA